MPRLTVLGRLAAIAGKPAVAAAKSSENVPFAGGTIVLAAGNACFIAGGINFIAGSVEKCAGDAYFIAGDAWNRSGPVYFASGGVDFASGDINFVSGDAFFASGGVKKSSGHARGRFQGSRNGSHWAWNQKNWFHHAIGQKKPPLRRNGQIAWFTHYGSLLGIVNGQVLAKLNWGGYSAFLGSCELRVDHGDGKGFVFPAIVTTPGCTDKHAFPTVLTKWNYKAICRVDEQQFGPWSQPVSNCSAGVR